MILFKKVPCIGERVLVAMTRGTSRVAQPLCNGSGLRSGSTLLLAEAVVASVGITNSSNRDGCFDYMQVQYNDNTVAVAQGTLSTVLLQNIYVAPEYIDTAFRALSSVGSASNEVKLFMLRYLIPVPVCSREYARLVRDITGVADLPRSSAAVLSDIRAEAAALGVEWLEITTAADDRTQPTAEANVPYLQRVVNNYTAMFGGIVDEEMLAAAESGDGAADSGYVYNYDSSEQDDDDDGDHNEDD